MSRLLLILPFCLWLTMASAVNLDSLWGVWNDKSQPDTNRLKAMNKIALVEYMDTQPDSAYFYAGLAYQMAEEKHNKKSMAILLQTQGISLYNQGKYDQALTYFKNCISLFEETGNKQGIASTYSNMGNIFVIQCNYEKALNHYNDYIKIAEETNDKKGLGNVYNNLGILFLDQGFLDKALKYHQKSLQIQKEFGSKLDMGNSYNNLGNTYLMQKNYAKAQEKYWKSLKLFQELSKDIGTTTYNMGESISYNNLGETYYYQGNYDKAQEHYWKSLDLSEEIDFKRGKAATYINLSNLSFDQGHHTQGLSYGNKGLDLAQEVGMINEIKQISELLYKEFKKYGKTDKALEMYELFTEMRDSINRIENKEAAIKMEYQHQYEKEQAVEEARHQEEMERQELIAISAGGGLVMVLFFAFFIFNRLRVTQRQKKIIEEQKKDITDSIRYAQQIQAALLPSAGELSQLPDHFVFFQPKDIVSGDFYWMKQHQDMLYFAACDCTGHGVPGAFMSMIGSALLDEAVVEKGITQPSKIFYDVRKGFIDTLKQTEDLDSQKDGMDAVLCSWNRNGKLEYATAYNPLFLIRNNKMQETKPDKQPVGYQIGNQQPFTHHELQLEKGDTIYLFSDGYQDQFGGPKGKKFKLSKFKNLLLSIQDKTMNEQKEVLEQSLAQWRGNEEQVDDILVMGVRFN